LLGPLELNRTRTTLAPWLGGLLALWREEARLKGIQWQADVPLTLGEATIDANQMARALGNLLSNAVKYTPSSGAIEVQARIEPDGAEPGAGSTVRVTVSDTGPGIPAADQRRIFEPFERGTGDRRFPQGVGLGLAIARDIVQAHGGVISLESSPGHGSCFILTFPTQ
jgi:signal transduction histidine kinase